jgi:hypothetical protein
MVGLVSRHLRGEPEEDHGSFSPNSKCAGRDLSLWPPERDAVVLGPLWRTFGRCCHNNWLKLCSAAERLSRA